jgi:formamidopyrimidine-DNA glycosylase
MKFMKNQSGCCVQILDISSSACPLCWNSIEKLSIGGGQTYFCSKCQK